MATLGGTTNPSYGSGHWTAPTAVAGALTLPAGGPWKITGLGMWMAGDSSLGATSSQPDCRLALWNSSGTILAYSSEFVPAANSYPNSDKQEKAISYGPINGGTSVRVGYIFDSGDAGGCQCSLESGGTRYYDTTSTSSSSCSFSTATGEPGVWLTYEAWNTAPTAPDLISPSNWTYLHDLTPDFTFKPHDPNADAATQRQIQVSTDSTFASVTHWDNTVSGTWADNTTSAAFTYAGTALTWNTTYYWRMRTYDTVSAAWGAWSGAFAYVPTNSGPGTSLNSPASGTHTAPALSPTLNFTISDVDGDNIAQYGLQVTTDPSFASITHWDYWPTGSWASGTVFNVPYAGTALTYNTTYYWRAVGNDGITWGSWTAGRTYYPYNAVPAAPTLNSPANAGVLTDTTPDLNFTPSDADGDAATQYRYQVDNNSDFSSPVEDTTVTGTFTNGVAINRTVVTTLSRGTTYYWRVQTYDAVSASWGAWSSSRSFSINALPVVTLTWPNADGNNFAKLLYTAGSGWATPRMYVEWTYSDTQAQVAYQVVITQCATSGGTYTAFYDSGSVASSSTRNITVPADLTEGYYYKVYVAAYDGYETGVSSTRTTRARWGKSVHAKDVQVGGVDPTTLLQNSLSTTTGSTSSVTYEWNSSPDGTTLNHATWQTSISSVTKDNYLHYRVWLLAWGATPVTSPSFNSIEVIASGFIAQPDKWLPADIGTVGGAIEIGDKYIGSQCLRINGNGTARTVYQDITIDTGVQHILQARIRSVGDSNAKVWLSDTSGTPIKGLDGVDDVTIGNLLAADEGWEQYVSEVFSPGVSTVRINCTVTGATATAGYFDAIKVERGPVASSWVPGLVGNAVTIDSGGIQVDASAGGIFRLRGSTGGTRDRIDLSANGIKFGGDIEMYSPSAGRITIKDNDPNNAEFAVGDDTTFFDADILDRVGIKSTSTPANGGFVFGADKDTNLYRGGANQLKTDDTFVAASLTIGAVTNAHVPSGAIVMWTGTDANIPTGWYLCDGANGTPDLRERMIVARASGAANSAGGTVSPTAALATHATHSNHTGLSHSGGAVDAHAGTAVSAHAAHSHELPFVISDTYAISSLDQSVFGTGTARTRDWTASSSDVGGSYAVADSQSVTVGAHTVTQPNAHTFTQPSAHADQGHSAHDGHAIMYYYKLAFIMKA